MYLWRNVGQGRRPWPLHWPLHDAIRNKYCKYFNSLFLLHKPLSVLDLYFSENNNPMVGKVIKADKLGISLNLDVEWRCRLVDS